jgi:hypothetical protein
MIRAYISARASVNISKYYRVKNTRTYGDNYVGLRIDTFIKGRDNRTSPQ